MIKEIKINDYEVLHESTIYIDCDLLQDWNRNEFMKKLIDLCEEYKSWIKEKSE